MSICLERKKCKIYFWKFYPHTIKHRWNAVKKTEELFEIVSCAHWTPVRDDLRRFRGTCNEYNRATAKLFLEHTKNCVCACICVARLRLRPAVYVFSSWRFLCDRTFSHSSFSSSHTRAPMTFKRVCGISFTTVCEWKLFIITQLQRKYGLESSCFFFFFFSFWDLI